MNRKDYTQVATIIRDLPMAMERRTFVAIAFANSFAANSASFNRRKFFEAAGVAELIPNADD